jgi:hypothetical protein
LILPGITPLNKEAAANSPTANITLGFNMEIVFKSRGLQQFMCFDVILGL